MKTTLHSILAAIAVALVYVGHFSTLATAKPTQAALCLGAGILLAFSVKAENLPVIGKLLGSTPPTP